MKLQSSVTSRQLDRLIEFATPLTQALGDEDDLDVAVQDLVVTVHASGFIEPYDWPTDYASRKQEIDDPAALASMDLDTFRRTIIAHVCADRFTEGHLKHLARTGYMAALVERARQLRATL